MTRLRDVWPSAIKGPQAAEEVRMLALKVLKQEKGRYDSSAFWFSLAQEIEDGRYATPQAADQLIVRFPFLKKWRT